MDSQIIAALIQAVPAFIIAFFALKISRKQGLSEENKLQLENHRAERELFEKFNERFNNMNEDLNSIQAGIFKEYDKKTQSGVIQDYLNLCCEEYLWRKRGLISDDIWSAWIEGINFYLKTEIISNFFIEESQVSTRAFYYDFFSISSSKNGILSFAFKPEDKH